MDALLDRLVRFCEEVAQGRYHEVEGVFEVS